MGATVDLKTDLYGFPHIVLGDTYLDTPRHMIFEAGPAINRCRHTYRYKTLDPAIHGNISSDGHFGDR